MAAGCREAVSGYKREDVCEAEGRYRQALHPHAAHLYRRRTPRFARHAARQKGKGESAVP